MKYFVERNENTLFQTFDRSILALLGSIRAREEGRPGAPRPQPVVMPQPTTIPAQQTQYNRYDQERFIRQKEGLLNNTYIYKLINY